MPTSAGSRSRPAELLGEQRLDVELPEAVTEAESVGDNALSHGLGGVKGLASTPARQRGASATPVVTPKRESVGIHGCLADNLALESADASTARQGGWAQPM